MPMPAAESSSVVLVWACDRIARSTRHFLEILDELNRLNIEFVSFREQIDTGGPLGRAIVIIIGAIAELERNLIIETSTGRHAAGEARRPAHRPAAHRPRSRSYLLRSSPRPEPAADRPLSPHLDGYGPPRPRQPVFSPTGASRMIENYADLIPLWMLLSAAFGFLAGDAFGDSTRHRKCLEQANDDLRDELEKARANEGPLRLQLKQQRGVINDIHKHILAVTKALQKRPS